MNTIDLLSRHYIFLLSSTIFFFSTSSHYIFPLSITLLFFLLLHDLYLKFVLFLARVCQGCNLNRVPQRSALVMEEMKIFGIRMPQQYQCRREIHVKFSCMLPVLLIIGSMFLHIGVIKFSNSNRTKVNFFISSMHGINCRKF